LNWTRRTDAESEWNTGVHVPEFIVVSGLPASGKATLAGAIARRLAIAHLDQDGLLESRFAFESEITPERRRQRSWDADKDFRKRTLSIHRAVLSS
jgi:shikimate kinase